ncbi:uncharacterized protein LOC129725471 [Wyeomyia smithii]|uniref:uncharacterized protein LOC129725471 n=1 Tax=Wyeomyia smithii TaxID=174621 RepID=UPI002467C7FE|nr:uncharacterized protein LOC129725471 [Wyeomyia smithii]
MESLELTFLEPCKKLLLTIYPEINTLINKIPENRDEAQNSSLPSRCNEYLLYCILVVPLCYTLLKLFNSKLIITKFINLKSIITPKIKPSHVPVLHFSKEIVEEWQQLFHKAMLLDSIIVRQMLGGNSRSTSSKNLKVPRKSTSRICNRHNGNKINRDVAQTFNPYRVNRYDCDICTAKPSTQPSSHIDLVQKKYTPKFVVTEELLQIKQEAVC